MTDFSLRSQARQTDAAASLAEAQVAREIRRMRMAAAALALALAGVIAWLVPWIPIGMRASDYSARTAAGIGAVALLGVACAAFAARWSPMLRREPLSELVHVLMGQSVLVRGSARFRRRLQTQCDRARDERGASFSLLVVDLPGVDRGSMEDERRFQDCLGAVRGAVRGQDVVGDSGASEIWLLLEGAGPEGCTGVVERIREGLTTTAAGQPGSLLAGFATFGVDGIADETLFRVARLRAQRTAGQREAA